MEHVYPVQLIPQEMPFAEFKKMFSRTKQHYFPVKNRAGQLVGIFSSTDIRAVLFSMEIEHLVVMNDIARTDIITTTPEEDLNTVLQKFTNRNIDSLPVVAEGDPTQLLGMLDRRAVIAFYNTQVAQRKAALSRED